MNRCLTSLPSTPGLVRQTRSTTPSAPWRSRLWAGWTLALWLPWAAHAQQQSGAERAFPATAQRGVLEVIQPPKVIFNGETTQLTPGARIRGVGNTLVLSGQLVGQSLQVMAVRDPASGHVHDVWMLSGTEQTSRPDTRVLRNFRFASDQEQRPRDDGKTPFNQLPKFGQQ